ncbi:MAG: ABC transporter ATP-binding protein, partial [Oscillospiraceae bacterium]|nr:ABC transporter ATP-binding protein [Oscillospiraceae bacterium]
METIKFGLKYFKKNIPIFIFAEILSFIGIMAELLLPLLSGMLIDFVILGSEVTDESGGVLHFLLSGRFGEVHTMRLF